MSFTGRVKAAYFSHPLYGVGYRCRGGYGGTLYEVDNVSDLTTAVAASGSKIIRFTTAGTYTLSDDLTIGDSYTTIENSSGGAVVLQGAGLRIGSNVTDVYVSGIEVDHTDVDVGTGDPVHINPGCSRIYFYKCAFYHGIDDSSLRSGGVTFHLCQFGPNWDSQYSEESQSNGGPGHAFGPFTTENCTGASFLYCLFHSLEYRAPLLSLGSNLVFGCVQYNCKIGYVITADGTYGEIMYSRTKAGPETAAGASERGVRIENSATAFVTDTTVDDLAAVFHTGSSANRDTTKNLFPFPAGDTAANHETYVLANVGPTSQSATLAAYIAQVSAGEGEILRS